jgi:elongation factor G
MPLSVLGQGKFARQTGGRGQYGHVVLRLVIDGADEGVTIVNDVVNGIPAQFIPAIESGIRVVIDEGKLAERGYSDARVELIDGSYHDVDSSDAAFFTAAVMAMEDALRQLPEESIDGDEPPGVRAPRRPRKPNPAAANAVPEPSND